MENNSFSASFFGDTDDDYEEDDTDERYYADDADEDDDNEDNASSFDLTGIFKRRAISWALAIFSPPATGPLFGLAAWIIQWQHKKDDET